MRIHAHESCINEGKLGTFIVLICSLTKMIDTIEQFVCLLFRKYIMIMAFKSSNDDDIIDMLNTIKILEAHLLDKKSISSIATSLNLVIAWLFSLLYLR